MAVSVHADVDPQALTDLSAVLQRLQDETGKSAAHSVNYAALKIAESGRKESRISKKNRDIVVNPNWSRKAQVPRWAVKQRKEGKGIPAEMESSLSDKSNSSPYFIEFRRQQKASVMMPAWAKKDPRREIRPVKQGGTRGLAKTIWSVMVGKLGAMLNGGSSRAWGEKYRILKKTERFGSDPAFVVHMFNKLTYLNEAYPGLVTTIITSGTKSLNNRLNDRIAKATARANRGK